MLSTGCPFIVVFLIVVGHYFLSMCQRMKDVFCGFKICDFALLLSSHLLYPFTFCHACVMAVSPNEV